ncbi:MAG: ABC transporter ATP-binding protein/permease [Chloroflexi bacterium]|nr:ABC transporter ATP-binding protein/permease [Chloroflexota bacterium]
MLTLVGVQVLVWVTSSAIGSLRSFISELFGSRVGATFSQMIYQKSATLDLAFFESPTFFNQMENALRQSGWGVERLIRTLGRMVQQSLTLVTMLILVFRLNPLAPCWIVLLALPRIAIEMTHARRRHDTSTRRSVDRRMASYLSGLLAWRDPVKEIRLFGLHHVLIDRLDEMRKKLLADEASFSVKRHFTEVALELLGTVGVAGVWISAALQAIAKQITLGDMGLYFQAARRARESLHSVIAISSSLYEDGMALGNLFTFLDLDSLSVEGALVKGPLAGRPVEVRVPIREGIEFRNVSFKYPGARENVLSDVSFTIKPGERVALVGSNGAGKTTLVKLLTRLYDPVDGAVLLDGKDLSDYDLDDLRRQFGVIFQDFVHYRLSVRDNIGFGQVELLDDTARIERSADHAGARTLLEKLPNGLETMLGRTYAEGVDLSGGEWQKIALARAFMRDAQILILDEPTASLDPDSESEVFRQFGELTRGKTSVVISHRFSTVRSADRVLVLQGGRLVEEGTHEALMAMNGEYTRMYNLQAERYTG